MRPPLLTGLNSGPGATPLRANQASKASRPSRFAVKRRGGLVPLPRTQIVLVRRSKSARSSAATSARRRPAPNSRAKSAASRGPAGERSRSHAATRARNSSWLNARLLRGEGPWTAGRSIARWWSSAEIMPSRHTCFSTPRNAARCLLAVAGASSLARRVRSAEVCSMRRALHGRDRMSQRPSDR